MWNFAHFVGGHATKFCEAHYEMSFCICFFNFFLNLSIGNSGKVNGVRKGGEREREREKQKHMGAL